MAPLKLGTVNHKLGKSARAKVTLAVKRANPFYLSAEWQSLRASIIKRRGPRCEDPDHDKSTPRSGVRIFGDHIVELRDGGAPLDPANILLRCGACHTRKTLETRGARYAARPDGQP